MVIKAGAVFLACQAFARHLISQGHFGVPEASLITGKIIACNGGLQ